MTAFREKLDKFVESQRGKSAYDAQSEAHHFSREVQEYVPKERWGNIFKYIVAYALGIGLGHALAAALIRGADELGSPAGIDAEPLAQSVEQGSFDADSFNAFMTEQVGIETVNFNDVDMNYFADAGGVDVPDADISVGLGDIGDVVSSFMDT